MKLALVQMEITQQNPHENFRKIASFTKRAKKQNADVIIFPECCVTGSVRGRPDLIDRSYSYRDFFQNLARENKIDIVTGSFVEQVGKRKFNTCYYVDRTGRVLGRYRKINLWLSERPHLNAGTKTVVFKTRFGKAGIAICWDLINPGIFRDMARKGADIVFCPSFWSSCGISNFRIEKDNINILCAARSVENALALVYVNAAGNIAHDDELIGHSQVTVPIRHAVSRLAHNKEALLFATLDLSILRRANGVYKLRNDIQSRSIF